MDKVMNHPDVLKHLQVPDKMYHVTSKENWEKIQKEGLTFGKPRASKEGEVRGVYLTSDVSDILGHQGDISHKGGHVVIQVDTQHIKHQLRLDPEYSPYGSSMTHEEAHKYVKGVNSNEEQYAVYHPHGIEAKHLKEVKTDRWGNIQ